LRSVAALDLQFRASELESGSLALPSALSASLGRDFSLQTVPLDSLPFHPCQDGW